MFISTPYLDTLRRRKGDHIMADSDLRERGDKWEQLLTKAGKSVSGVFGVSGAEFATRDLATAEMTLDVIRDEVEAVLDEIILLQTHFGETISVAELQSAIENLR